MTPFATVRFLGALVLLSLASAAAPGPATPGVPGAAKDRPQSDAEREVLAAIKAFGEAAAKRDRAAVERYYAPGFTMVPRNGMVDSREVWVEKVMKGELTLHKADEHEELEQDVALPGPGLAVVTMLARYRQTDAKRDTCLRTRTVLLKQDGQWRAVSGQTTLLHDGPLVELSHEGLVGKYEIEGARRWEVTQTGRTLFGSTPWGTRMPMFETPGGSFEGPLGRSRFDFQRDDRGRATGVTFSGEGKVLWRAKRVD
jgi:ketosteroid isomerase-like protein